jgi:type II secretory pathway pseudopilin PulG
MKPVMLRQSGFSLLELLISSSIAVGLLMVILLLFVLSNRTALEQQQLSQLLQKSESVRHMITHSVRDALYTQPAAMLPPLSVPSVPSCQGINVGDLCRPPLQIWAQGASAPLAAPPAVPGSYLFWIRQSCCPGVVADVFFLWYRAGNVAHPPSLFRRRQLSDGSFSASEELVEGVSHLVPSLTITTTDTRDSALQYVTGVKPQDISDWWNIVAVEFEVRLAAPPLAAAGAGTIAFTVASRQGSQ